MDAQMFYPAWTTSKLLLEKSVEWAGIHDLWLKYHVCTKLRGSKQPGTTLYAGNCLYIKIFFFFLYIYI